VAYNRPVHLKKTIEALQQALVHIPDDFSYEVMVTVDGWDKSRNPDSENWDEVRTLIEDFGLPSEVREENFGLRKNILTILDKFKKSEYDVLFLVEDDIIISPGAFLYFDEMLRRYKEDPSVLQITGFTPVTKKNPEVIRFPRLCSWLWATWRDKLPDLEQFELDWDEFDLESWLAKNQSNLLLMPDVPGLFRSQKAGRINAWTLDLLIWMIDHKLTTIYPTYPMVKNIGHDGTGVHCGNRRNGLFSRSIPDVTTIDWAEVAENSNPKILEKFARYSSPKILDKIGRAIYGR
jgi:glycosyltransferase involved in cell wall biosynthesis